MSAKPFRELTDAEVMAEVGRRLAGLRGEMNQEESAARAGLARPTVSRAENGDNPTLATIVRLLRGYGRLDVLEEFIPPIPVSPMQLLRDRELRSGRRDG